jgi:hypothetical protein
MRVRTMDITHTHTNTRTHARTYRLPLCALKREHTAATQIVSQQRCVRVRVDVRAVELVKRLVRY